MILLLAGTPAQAAAPAVPAGTFTVGALSAGSAATTARQTLSSGAALPTTTHLRSADGTTTAFVQGDGNFVLYRYGKAIWSTNTYGKGASRLSLTSDGNLVLRNGSGVTWQSRTGGKGVKRLVVGNRGVLALQTAAGKNVWTSDKPVTVVSPIKAGSYYLPFPKGKSYRISQSPGGSTSHNSGGSRFAIDFAMPTGSTVTASRAGTVRDAKWTSGGGGMGVLVDHGGNLCTFYAHLSRFDVKVGQKVATGQRIALSGATGNATGPHLHFSLVYCSSYQGAKTVNTVEMGTSYPTGSYATSKNA